MPFRAQIFEVYRELGYGFLESVYQECPERELTERGIAFESQRELTERGIAFESQRELQLVYKGEPLQQTFKPDLICCR